MLGRMFLLCHPGMEEKNGGGAQLLGQFWALLSEPGQEDQSSHAQGHGMRPQHTASSRYVRSQTVSASSNHLSDKCSVNASFFQQLSPSPRPTVQ